MVMGAMGACLSNRIDLNAPRNGIDLEGMEIIIKADIDPSVFRGQKPRTALRPYPQHQLRSKRQR
ncbi:MAG: hypothetical protein FI716_10240 [SAR202 cluster bacterium]|nr:hypothetical protein [SAR202 cluster bacterium]